MTCDRALELIMDRVMGDAGAEDLRELEAHVAGCPSCAAAARDTERVWTRLGADVVATPDVEGGVQRLREAIARERAGFARDRAAARSHRAVLLGVAAASLLAGLALGTAWRGTRDAGPATAGGAQFVMLLREAPPTPKPDSAMRAIVAEYAAWAGALSRDGRLVVAEKLADDGGRMLRATPDARADVVSGLFVVRARDYAEAERLARESPHVRHGGVIELRRIDDESGR